MDWNNLLNTQPAPLVSDTSEETYRAVSQESRTRFWPVVEESLYVGMMGPDGSVQNVPALQDAQHPIDALAIASAWNMDCVAVCQGDTYQGVYRSSDIAEHIGQQWSFQLPGSTIWFEHPADKPFGGDWIRAVEAEGIRVVAFASDFVEERRSFSSFARLDQRDPTAALATLERLGATILGYYPKGQRAQEAEDHLDHLMHYLNL